MIKAIVTDPHLRALTHLDTEAVIDPVTVEDWDSGEHTLTLGYPLTGPVGGYRATVLGDFWDKTLEEVDNLEL